MKARIQAGAQIDAIIVSVPEPVRPAAQAHPAPPHTSLRAALRRVPLHDPATKAALRSLARHWQLLQEEIDDLNAQLTPLITAAAPGLMGLPGGFTRRTGGSVRGREGCWPPSPGGQGRPPAVIISSNIEYLDRNIQNGRGRS